jgi:hypothetical protein
MIELFDFGCCMLYSSCKLFLENFWVSKSPVQYYCSRLQGTEDGWIGFGDPSSLHLHITNHARFASVYQTEAPASIKAFCCGWRLRI